MRISAIILARGGSKGVLNKNIIDFCGHPLLAWTIMQLKNASLVTDIWVSSDSPAILAIAEKYGAKTIIRPKEIAGDDASSESGWAHAIGIIESVGGESIDYILAPQVSSPLRESKDFSDALHHFVAEKADSLMSVVEINDFFMWKRNPAGCMESINYDYKNRQPRQKIEARYLENGSFYIFKPDLIKRNHNRLGGKIAIFIMEPYKMFQIDAPEDVQLCSVIMAGYNLDRV